MEKLAFIGFGEAARTISRTLLSAKAARITAYDILFGSAQAKCGPEQLGGRKTGARAELLRAIRRAMGKEQG